MRQVKWAVAAAGAAAISLPALWTQSAALAATKDKGSITLGKGVSRRGRAETRVQDKLLGQMRQVWALRRPSLEPLFAMDMRGPRFAPADQRTVQRAEAAAMVAAQVGKGPVAVCEPIRGRGIS